LDFAPFSNRSAQVDAQFDRLPHFIRESQKNFGIAKAKSSGLEGFALSAIHGHVRLALN